MLKRNIVWTIIALSSVVAIGCRAGSTAVGQPSPVVVASATTAVVPPSVKEPSSGHGAPKMGEERVSRSDFQAPTFPGSDQDELSRALLPSPTSGDMVDIRVSMSLAHRPVEDVLAYYQAECPKLQVHRTGTEVYLLAPSTEPSDFPEGGERVVLRPTDSNQTSIRIESFRPMTANTKETP